MPPVSGPPDIAHRPTDPGERPPTDGPSGPPDGGAAARPPGRLAHPPSERYARGAASGVAGDPARASPATGRATLLGALLPAIGAVLVTAIALVAVGGVVAEQRGLLFIAGFGGAAIGLLAAGTAVSPDGIRPPALPRSGVVRAAMGLALLAVALGALGTWAYARLEGGVLDPASYLWTVFGPLVPAEAALAAVAAAWGASAGPVRSRS